MRLVAQRVRSPQGIEGINAFCYLHGPLAWFDRPPPELSSAGHLVNSLLEVRPPGNHVRSYLEISTPDETPNLRIQKDVTDCIDLFDDPSFPLDIQSGDSTFRFDLELPLAPAWRRELVVLLHRALEVRV